MAKPQGVEVAKQQTMVIRRMRKCDLACLQRKSKGAISILRATSARRTAPSADGGRRGRRRGRRG